MEDKNPIHPIGSVLMSGAFRCQVIAEYWNGKVDVQFDDGSKTVLTLSQQRRATRIDANAAPLPNTTTFYITRHRPAIAQGGVVVFDGITLTIEQLENALAKAKETI